MRRKQHIDESANLPLASPEKRTNRLTFDGRSKKVQIHATPYLWKAVDAIRDREAAAGRPMSLSRTLRALIMLGIEQYRKLNRLPSREV